MRVECMELLVDHFLRDVVPPLQNLSLFLLTQLECKDCLFQKLGWRPWILTSDVMVWNLLTDVMPCRCFGVTQALQRSARE